MQAGFQSSSSFKIISIGRFQGFLCPVSKLPIVFFMLKNKSCKLLAEIHTVKKKNT